MTSFGKSYLLRTFTKETGVSPYRYLQNVRLKQAKKLFGAGGDTSGCFRYDWVF